MQVSLDWNQGVGRAVFHLQAIEENLLFRLFQDLELPGWLASWPPSNFKICWVLSHITSLALFLPPTSTFKDSNDYIEPTWLVQDNPPILLISWNLHSPLLCNRTYPQVLEIRTRSSLQAIFPPTTPAQVGHIHAALGNTLLTVTFYTVLTKW